MRQTRRNKSGGRLRSGPPRCRASTLHRLCRTDRLRGHRDFSERPPSDERRCRDGAEEIRRTPTLEIFVFRRDDMRAYHNKTPECSEMLLDRYRRVTQHLYGVTIRDGLAAFGLPRRLLESSWQLRACSSRIEDTRSPSFPRRPSISDVSHADLPPAAHSSTSFSRAVKASSINSWPHMAWTSCLHRSPLLRLAAFGVGKCHNGSMARQTKRPIASDLT